MYEGKRADPGALHSHCPVCGKARLSDRFEVKGYLITYCPDCTVQFVRQILTLEFLRRFYQDQEGHRLYLDDNKDCLNYYNSKIRAEIEALRPGRGRILDLGCSTGLFLELMEGWERHGVEISEEYGEIARRRIGGDVFIGPVEGYPLRDSYFDVITMFDMFDHLMDPNAVLAKCHAMLKPGGLIVLKVHNISCLLATITGSRFYAIEPPAHLFYYNRESLMLLLERHGFDFVKARFIGHMLKLKTVFFRLSRSGHSRLLYRVYRLLSRNRLGDFAVPKNLHDIITVIAVKAT